MQTSKIIKFYERPKFACFGNFLSLENSWKNSLNSIVKRWMRKIKIDTKMGKVGCLGKGAGRKSDLLQNCASIPYK